MPGPDRGVAATPPWRVYFLAHITIWAPFMRRGKGRLEPGVYRKERIFFTPHPITTHWVNANRPLAGRRFCCAKSTPCGRNNFLQLLVHGSTSYHILFLAILGAPRRPPPWDETLATLSPPPAVAAPAPPENPNISRVAGYPHHMSSNSSGGIDLSNVPASPRTPSPPPANPPSGQIHPLASGRRPLPSISSRVRYTHRVPQPSTA